MTALNHAKRPKHYETHKARDESVLLVANRRMRRAIKTTEANR